MGRILCSKHGKRDIAHVCAHVHEATLVGRGSHPLPLRTVDIDLDLPIDGVATVLVIGVCGPCWERAERTFPSGQILEEEWDDIGGHASCAACLAEYTAPAGLPPLRLITRD